MIYSQQSDNTVPIEDISLGATVSFNPVPDDVVGGLTALKGESSDGNTITAIPFYAWSNRGVTSMKVWLPVAAE